MTDSTFSALLLAQVRQDGARPLVTFYDDETGERVELSVITYANWVAKTASLLQDEFDIERGSRVLVDLPTHWLGPVWLGAVWSVGATVVDPGSTGADLVVCGPATVSAHATQSVPVVALSLRPLGARFTDPLPAGVTDYGAVVWGQPDAFVAYDEPAPGDLAWDGSRGPVDQDHLLAEARSGPWGVPGIRLLTGANPCTRDGAATLLGPLTAGGGTVWVAHPAADGWRRRAEAEHATLVVEE